jgi:hypothetical protein
MRVTIPRAKSPLTAKPGFFHKGNREAPRQVQEVALAYGDDLQMGLEQRIVPRPQRGQETIAPMLVLIRIHRADLCRAAKKPVDHGAALSLSGPQF